MMLSKFVTKSLAEIKKGIDDFNLSSELEGNAPKAFYPEKIQFSLGIDSFLDEDDETEYILANCVLDKDSDRKINFFVDWRKF